MENLSLLNNSINFSSLNISFQPGHLADKCMTASGAYMPECLVKWFCPQISHYFVNYALGIVVAYVALSWLMWAYWRFINDKVPWEKITHSGGFNAVLAWAVGDLSIYENQVRAELFIRDKLEKLMVGFIFVLWWFYRLS